MKRIDNGFQESFLLQAPHNVPTSIVRSNTAPTRRLNPKKTTVESVSIQPKDMEPQRPASGNKSRPSHQRSRTSPSETSTTPSKGRGHGSKPSSRRTSCTIVDPSRSRHHRMQNTHTVSSANRQDIDDVYALHHRSYSLFQNPSLHSRSSAPSPALSHLEHFGFPIASPRFSVDEANTIEEHSSPKMSEETIAIAEKTNVPMHWTSPCTRRRQYEKIDRANSGMRGLMNKVMPLCVSGPQERFYEKDKSDAGSVRRYRLDDNEEEEQNNEKDVARSRIAAMKRSNTRKTSWTCF
ncbi:hypothetical protein EK21DRAFT_64454 [Setomelanomma holmii]|uniref:Uncharacterized protein n=1 Tax=Setomelanomma holmii TaxID=210430 RepID=A0A9P4HC20_9PLEO|nr:hypothetical protein EK21DRAFT_64454 [Setomelanomma holmii]